MLSCMTDWILINYTA